MSVTPDVGARPALRAEFAAALPELAVPWQADPPPAPRVLLLNEGLAAELGLDADWLRSPAGVAFLTGTAVPGAAHPVAQAYAGHQFGNYSPRLGDGRALLLGELTDTAGALRDVHLKGSGPTPFSRGGDGYAAVGPMLREYLVSESMHALGVPTTRALAVVATGREVYRETVLPGAVLTRVASSHLRVGTFQFAAATGDLALLRRLADYAIERHHPQVSGHRYLGLFDAVLAAQAELVAAWMAVGFVHGVMNTDNMTISGQTIDYGPCAFLDRTDPAAVFSSIDHAGRYAYGAQPGIATWNLARFAETLLPLLDADVDAAIATATGALDGFAPRFAAAWTAALTAKLGLTGEQVALANDLMELLTAHGVDFTDFFRRLGRAAGGDTAAVTALFPGGAADGWLARWLAAGPDGAAMARVNPLYLPSNHLIEPALTAATAGDLTPVTALLDAITAPFTERPGLERLAAPAPEEFGTYRTFCGT